MTINLWSEERDSICLNCARRIVSAPARSSKYGRLREYLSRRGRFTSFVTLSFSEIEGIIRNNLPLGALRSEEWWDNGGRTSQSYSWASVGWRVRKVNLEELTVTFHKLLKKTPAKLSKKKLSRKKIVQKPFTPVAVKPLRFPKPSKTRIAKTVARARNIQRKRLTGQRKIKMKPKSAYEKRLYKSEAKPRS